MLDGLDLASLTDVARVAGGGGLFVWFLVVLLKRSDVLQRENIDELRAQRDDWRRRAEAAEAIVAAMTGLPDHEDGGAG